MNYPLSCIFIFVSLNNKGYEGLGRIIVSMHHPVLINMRHASIKNKKMVNIDGKNSKDKSKKICKRCEIKSSLSTLSHSAYYGFC